MIDQGLCPPALRPPKPQAVSMMASNRLIVMGLRAHVAKHLHVFSCINFFASWGLRPHTLAQ